MANSINNVSPSIRDFLLTKNLVLADSIKNSGLVSVAVGLGTQAQITEFPEAVKPSIDIETSSPEFKEDIIGKNAFQPNETQGLVNITTTNLQTNNSPSDTPTVEYGKYVGSQTEDSKFLNVTDEVRKDITLKNKYLSTENMVQATIINNDFAYSQIQGNYLDESGELNYGEPSTQAYDTAASLVSQEGFGLDSSGFYPQSDIKTTVAGRVLGATGAIKDSQLGIIAGEQLLLALGQKLTFNTQKELLGKVNLQPFSLLAGDDFINPNYDITIRDPEATTTGGKILDVGANLIGLELPKSVIDPSGSIFEDENNFGEFSDLSESSILRNNSLIKNTGKGQLTRLFDLLNKNTYTPNYETSEDSKLGIETPNTYGSEDNSIGLTELNDDGSDFMWGQEKELLTREDSLLNKTKQLFSDNPRLQKVLFTNDPIIDKSYNEVSTPANELSSMFSKGSAIQNGDYLKGKDVDKVFCRTWTSTDRYDSVRSLQKNYGLLKYGKKREGIENSVLGQNGFAKISPYSTGSPENKVGNPKKYMLSLENLAWANDLNRLPGIEIGAGDLETGTKGRIMWFPPYGIDFSESTSVNWDSTEFIGRGEPVYTYNNTERSGTLSFQVIIDYPDYLNDTKINTDEVIASLAAGCMDYDEYFSVEEKEQIIIEQAPYVEKPKVVVSKQPELTPIDIYFGNDNTSLLDGYETLGSRTEPIDSIQPLTPVDGTTALTESNPKDYGLNKPWLPEFLDGDDGYIAKLNGDYEHYQINIVGHASKDGTKAANQTLSDKRAETIKNWLIDTWGIESSRIIKVEGEGDENENAATGDVGSIHAKVGRRVNITFEYVAKEDEQIETTVDAKTETPKDTKEILSSISRRFHNESQYFKELENSEDVNDKIIYDSIREQIGFFQPAFHSITPEGFNSRLTFLQQCTRQGPTDGKKSASNLSFGMPPVCILRIGDFYNTKIIINNLDLSFEPLVWDLNPEGVGVQPMIANVTLNFKFIGGSSLKGPINKLQNAISFNYFANTEIFDGRADTLGPADETSGLSAIIPGVSGVTDTYETVESDKNLSGMDLTRAPKAQLIETETELDKPLAKPTYDASKLNAISISSNDNYTEGDSYIDINFKINSNAITSFELNHLHNGTIYLQSTDDTNLNVALGEIVAKPENDLSFTIEGYDGNDPFTVGEGGGEAIHLIRLNNLDDSSMTELNDALLGGNYTLRLKWDVKVTSNCNFTK